MSENNADSFNPKTWLDAKPPTSSSSGANDGPGFDPRSWVGQGEDAADSPETPAKGARLKWSVAIGALGAVMLGGFFFLSSDGEEANAASSAETMAGEASPTAPETRETPARTFAGKQQLTTVDGYRGLVQTLIDMRVPADEAGALGRETIAALDSADKEMQIEIWLAEGENGQETQFMAASLPSGASVELTRRADGGFDRRDVFAEIRTEIRRVEGEMGETDFYSAAVVAGMPDSLVTPFAKIFSYDFSFADEVDAGDRFMALWQEDVTEDGETVEGSLRLLYARMVTKKGDREYFSFAPPGAVETQWFDTGGQANVRSLMRTPVDGARVSSQFGFRNHPIRQRRILHGGVDFAAPTGTPIYASGDATVDFRAPAGGAGNMVRLAHGDGMITRYLHLSKFRDDLTVGQQVRQGEVIGYVGSTGASTGPHLHYEIIINGEKVDPLTFETTKVEPLVGEGLTMFRQQRALLGEKLD